MQFSFQASNNFCMPERRLPIKYWRPTNKSEQRSAANCQVPQMANGPEVNKLQGLAKKASYMAGQHLQRRRLRLPYSFCGKVKVLPNTGFT